MIPGPRPADVTDASAAVLRTGGCAEQPRPSAGRRPAVAVTRTARGWTVVSAGTSECVGDLVEAMTLADLVAEEHGALPEPDRMARRSARGPAGDPAAESIDARITALERTVAQLEHALAARVSTERAIGVLAERHHRSPRAVFEELRRAARSQGRPVVELAREVLDGLGDGTDGYRRSVPAADGARSGAVVTSVLPPAPRSAACGKAAGNPVVAAGGGRS